MINPGKGDIPQPSLLRCSVLPRTRASYKTHKKRETYHFDTVPLRPNQSFCNIDRGSEKLAQLPLPASRQPSTTLRTRAVPRARIPTGKKENNGSTLMAFIAGCNFFCAGIRAKTICQAWLLVTTSTLECTVRQARVESTWIPLLYIREALRFPWHPCSPSAKRQVVVGENGAGYFGVRFEGWKK